MKHNKSYEKKRKLTNLEWLHIKYHNNIISEYRFDGQTQYSRSGNDYRFALFSDRLFSDFQSIKKCSFFVISSCPYF